MNKGTVYLIGAGPGDPRLITWRGLQCLERADVVVYDRLVSPRLLKRARADAELLYVGKLPDQSTLPQQEKINRLLVEQALAGKTVARLKGGDPSIFAYVGEEAEMLRAQGIAYEIIPGVSSAFSVPAYAGIPVTYRNMATSVHVISGHEDPLSPDSLTDWSTLAKVGGTLVILMGVGRLAGIVSRLVEHGRSPDTPVALIRWGTVAEQETLTGTLADIVERVRETNFQNPAIIVIGEVVRLREKLRWFEEKPLFGQRIVVTRSRSQASDLSARIEELGGEPYEFPVIETQWPEDLASLDDALAQLSSYDWVMFTSVNGVEKFFERMFVKRFDVRSLAAVKFAVVGDKTAEQLTQRGIFPDVVAEEFVAEGLLQTLQDQGELQAGQRVLLPRANIARKALPDALRAFGCEVTDAEAYRTVAVNDGAEQLVALLEAKQIHAVTFTSSSTVKNFVQALAGQDLTALLTGVKVAAIGPVTKRTAQELGLKVDVMPDTYTIPELVDALGRGLQHRMD
ncbi:MAG TPA: uroporphyrinogen-III C-methyltransferase [Bacilli bacterium]|nr:uroporphyrinogen-III C-methyltransferase [Bacilli bacterium]